MSPRAFHAGPLGYRPSPWNSQARWSVEIEERTILVDPPEEISNDSPFVADLTTRAIGCAERFASALTLEHVEAIAGTVADGLRAMSERQAEGFTLCPLVTREIRIPRFVPRGRVDVEINAGAAILTFHQGGEPGPSSWVRAHQGLCRTYYQSVLKRFVEKRLEQRLSVRSFVRLWQVEAFVVSSLGRCMEEMRERFPLDPYQKRSESLLHDGAGAPEVLDRLTRSMLADASRRLGL